MPAISHISRAHHFSCDIVDESHASRFAPWIDLETQRLSHGLLHDDLEDNGERVPPIHGRPALFQEQAGIPRMHRVEWPLLCIQDKHFGPSEFLSFCSCEPPLSRVMLTSPTFS